MKIEHITTITHHGVVRDSSDILLPTRHHFLGALPQGKVPVLIPGTTLSVVVSVDWPAAIFTLFKAEIPLFMNFCCFEAGGRETVLNLVREAMRQTPASAAMPALKSPSIDTFLITIPVLPFANQEELILCGEIELYLYDAIFQRHQS